MRIIGCLRWLWKTTKGMRMHIGGNALSGTLHVGVSLLFIWTSKRLVDIATGQATGTFVFYAVMMGLCAVLQLFFSTIGSRLSSLTETKMSNRLRQRLFTHIMQSRWMGRERMHTGDMQNRLEEDVTVVSDVLCRVVPSVWVTTVRLSAAFAYLFFLDSRLAVVLFFIMPVALLTSKRYIRRMQHLTRDIRTTDSRVQTHLQENLQHRTLISTLERTDGVTDTLYSLQDILYRQVKRRTDFSLFSRTLVQAGFAAGYMAAFLWGASGLYYGRVTFGMVTAFLQLVGQVQRPIVEFGNQIPAFVRAFISVERLEELAGLPLEEQGKPIRLTGRTGIRMEELCFSYPGSERVLLHRFSHDFTPGSLTAIVGETGAGKSTLMRLILALLQPDRGRIIFYDNQQEVEASSLTRCNIICVPQGNSLLSGTIRENLLLGNPDATDEELRHALHLAVADFVYELPQGLETPCGELGTGLSEGQAQRIAIARGLLRPGGILLMDEPSSSLDKETELTLLRRLSEMVKDKTLLLVTHREAIATLCTHTVRIGN